MSINVMFEKMGEQKVVALRGFHEFTGSDVISSFTIKGKQIAWKVWKSFPEAIKAFKTIYILQKFISNETFQVQEKFYFTTKTQKTFKSIILEIFSLLRKDTVYKVCPQ